MARINLLPWRAERRKQREREFYRQLGLALAAGVIVIIAWSAWMGQRIDNQHDRNAYLKGQIHQVDAKIAKIKNLKKVRSQLLARKQIIEKLQSSRSQMVHLFDSLVKTIPNSVRLTSLKQNGMHLELTGVAQSNASVADYMNNLQASPWLGSPDLEKTVNHHDGAQMPYSFGLGLTLSKPSEAKHKAAAAAKARGNGAATAASVAVKMPAPVSGAASGPAHTAATHTAGKADKAPPGKVSVTSMPVANRGAKS